MSISKTWAKKQARELAATVDALRSNCISTRPIFQIEDREKLKTKKSARMSGGGQSCKKTMQSKFLNYPSFQAQG
ncbi:MAG: hypothetical protein WDN50_20900 [Bradyrhizobium sp.]